MKITIYTTNTCAYCAMVKKYIGAKAPEGTVVEVINLDEYPERRQEAFDLSNGAMTVPITVVRHFLSVMGGEMWEDRVVVGWKPSELAKALS